MRPDLENLRHEIEQHLESRGMSVFRSYPREPRGLDSANPLAGAVYWDSENHPDYREFVEAASAAGVRMVTLHAREFTSEVVETALTHLSETDLDRDDKRSFEARLNEIRAYEGFTCEIELGFDLAQRTYVFEVRTDWFDELNEMVERIEYSYQDDEEDENPLSGYYSNN